MSGEHIVVVTAKSWYEALDPNVTNVLVEAGVPEPTRHPIGRSAQYRYGYLTAEQVDVIRKKLEHHAWLCTEGDAHQRAEYASTRAALRRDIARLPDTQP